MVLVKELELTKVEVVVKKLKLKNLTIETIKMETQCIICGRPTTDPGRVCKSCTKRLQDTFEENINNKTKSHDKKNRKSNRKV